MTEEVPKEESQFKIPPEAQRLIDKAEHPHTNARVDHAEDGAGMSTYAARLGAEGEKAVGEPSLDVGEKAHKPSTKRVYGSEQLSIADGDPTATEKNERIKGGAEVYDLTDEERRLALEGIEAAKRIVEDSSDKK